MNALLVGINAKFIHTNLAIRSIKVNSSYNVDFIEFTIKDSIDFIINKIIDYNTKVIGFSCYIWNIEIILEIIKQLNYTNNYKIILGGPEVTYDSYNLLKNHKIDYVVLGEGELAFNKVLNNIYKKSPLLENSSVSYKKEDKIIINNVEEIKDLSILQSPYYLKEDIPNLKNKIQYLESSRGCPYHCSYCMASLEKNVRYFDIKKLKQTILYLQKNGAKTFKFLDRTFNINKSVVLDLFDFIIKNHYPNTSFQFEITGDILPKDIITYLNNHAPKNLIRFEIGIQSTNNETNLSVNRKQNNKILLENIKLIQDGEIIDLHLDLIAGLPYETINIFEKTFNDCFSLQPKELQLGFLKMLKGTPIRINSDKYKYVFSNKAPYQIIENEFLSTIDINNIHLAEEMLEKYWNSGFCIKTLKKLFFEYNENSFKFFMNLGIYWKNNNYQFIKYQLDELFKRLDDYLIYINHENYSDLHDELKYDYLIKNNLKPKLWFPKIDKSLKNKILRTYYKNNQTHTLDTLYKYSLLTTYKNTYLLVIYKNNQKYFHIL